MKHHPFPEDPPEGKCWTCPDCGSWSTLGNNAGYHRNVKQHGAPILRDIPKQKAKRPDDGRMSHTAFQEKFGNGAPKTGSDIRPSSPPIRLPKPSVANKTEERYSHVLQIEFRASEGYRIEYEPLTFRLAAGTRYTPDWIVWKGDRIVLAVEVKGGYKLGSQGRSIVAFKQAIFEKPNIKFRFAQDTGHGWNVVDS